MAAIGWPRPTVRLRLALTYTALFVITGTALLAVSYLLVQHREKGPASAVKVICSKSVNGQTVTQIGGTVHIQPGAGQESGNLALNPAQCPDLVGSAYYFRSFESSATGSQSGSGMVVAPASQKPTPPVPPAVQAEVRNLTAAVSLSQTHTLDSLKIESVLALGLISVLSFGLSWWMAGRALAPVHRITDTALNLSERTLHERINLQGPNDELKQLADTFDAMLARLERAFASQHRFVANASHELRTPLATERVLIDEALAEPGAIPDHLQTILEQLRTNSQDTEQLIDGLLALARSERGIDQTSPVDLASVVTSVIDQSAVEAAAAGVTLTCTVEPAVVNGDPGLLERVAGNLVENAIRHNQPNGTASVSVTSTPDTALLEVDNTGCDLEPDSVHTLFEPFRRAGPDRASNDGGAGLGLSIVRAVVTAHHGSIKLTARPQGGLHVRVELPLQAMPDTHHTHRYGASQHTRALPQKPTGEPPR